MIDLASPPLSLSQIARRLGALRADRPVSPTTVARWISRGLFVEGKGRIKLAAFKVGRTLAVTEGQLQAFLAELNDGESTTPTPPPAKKLPTGIGATKELNRQGVGV